MEFNLFKWFGKKGESQESITSRKCSIGIEVPEDVDINELNNKITQWQEFAKKWRGKKDKLPEEHVAKIANEVYSLLGKTAEAEVLLANISIDLEISRRAGTFDEVAYRGYSKLNEINVFNTILKGKTPEEMNKYLEWCYKTAARSLTLNTLLRSAVIVGGGVAAGMVGVPLLAAAVATTAGAVSGWHIGRTISRHSAEGKFNAKMEELNELVSERNGVENLSPEEVEKYVQELLKGGHRFGKKLGVDEHGRIDGNSVPAKLLTRFNQILKDKAESGNFSEAEKQEREEYVSDMVEEYINIYNDVFQRAQRQTPPLDETAEKIEQRNAEIQYYQLVRFLDEYKDELQKDEYESFMETVHDLQYELRKIMISAGLGGGATTEQINERVEEVRMWIKEIDKSIEEEFSRKVIREKAKSMNNIFRALRADQAKEMWHGRYGAVGGALFGNIVRAIYDVTIKGESIANFFRSHFSVKSIEGSIIDERISSGRPAPAVERSHVLTSQTGGGSASIAAPSATPYPDVSATPQTPPAATEPVVSKDGEVEVPTNGIEQPAGERAPARPAGTIQSHAEKAVELISPSYGKMPEDWAMLKFLGQHLNDEVQKNLAGVKAGAFPAHERGTLLNVLYNLKERGLISMEGERVTLKIDESELERMYQKSHGTPHATADMYGKKIGLKHWQEWFGGAKPAQAVKESVYEWESKEHLAAEKGLVTDKNIDEATQRLKRYGAGVVQQATPSISVEPTSSVPVESATSSVVPEAASAAATDSAVAPSPDATESIVTEAVSSQNAGTPSAKVEQPAAEKNTAKVEPEQKITTKAVTEQATPSGKVEIAAETPKAELKLSPEELAQQAYQDMQEALHKKYGIEPLVVEQVQALRVSTFLERAVDVKAGNTDVQSAFSSSQFSLKEYEKLVSYITEHKPNAGEKRMLLRNYLLSKEK